MTSPKTPEYLAQAIEELIASYIDSGRRAAEGALESAFAGRPAANVGSRRGGRRSSQRAAATRRSAAVLAAVSDRLYELVRATPGESMARLAEQTGIRAADLHRPMAKLKADGRVRSVGQRHLTRYFPAVGRRSEDADS